MERFVVLLLMVTCLSAFVYASAPENLTDEGIEGKLTNTGDGTLDGIINFLINSSPVLLLIIGIALIIGSDLGKFVGTALVIIALIQIAMMLLS